MTRAPALRPLAALALLAACRCQASRVVNRSVARVEPPPSKLQLSLPRAGAGPLDSGVAGLPTVAHVRELADEDGSPQTTASGLPAEDVHQKSPPGVEDGHRASRVVDRSAARVVRAEPPLSKPPLPLPHAGLAGDRDPPAALSPLLGEGAGALDSGLAELPTSALQDELADEGQNPTTTSLSAEEMHQKRVAEAFCSDYVDQKSCNKAKTGNGWKCKWKLPDDGVGEEACVAMSPCAWSGLPLVDSDIFLMWFLAFLNSSECILRLFNGCGIGMGLWCLASFAICTCCFCLPCYLSTSESAPSLGDRPCRDCGGGWATGNGASWFGETLIVDDSNSGHDWRMLGGFTCEAELESMEVKIDWWGKTTGRVRASLLRGGSVISTCDVFDACGHVQRPQSIDTRQFTRGNTADGELVSSARAGDELRFEYALGMGHGDGLKIKYIEAIPQYQRDVLV